jgi:DNA-binding beta-propeller fold protein YncE
VGSLGYWLAQQSVERGSQPLYYYYAVQVPIYEYLPALGCLLTIIVILWRNARKSKISKENFSPNQLESENLENIDELQNSEINNNIDEPPILSLLGFWVLTSIFAYSIAGEKMPWLTVHITLPMILFASWGIGQIIDHIDWDAFKSQRGLLILGLVVIFFTSLFSTLSSLLGDNQPFQGDSLNQLSATSKFLISLVFALASGIGLIYLLKQWSNFQTIRIFILVFFGLLAVLTMRVSFTASYINYDQANELLVYAHSAPGVRIAMDQIEDISLRLTGSRDMVVAYDNETSYPYWWYLRNYKNQRAYAANPTRDLRDVNTILVGSGNYTKLEPIVGQAYQEFEYIRIWWPNQDYYNLTWERIRNAIKDPQMRSALFQIWLNRDYTKYGQITNKDLSMQNWSPSERFRLYIRKDIVSQLWNYGVTPSAEEVIADPYEGKQLELSPDRMIGAEGFEDGQFRTPRNLAVAPDNTIYVADTGNHRIQHLTSEGEVIHVWGKFADIAQGQAPGGTFNEPWGITVAPDGSVYVADTWNHRIQKFTSEGDFVTMWGFFGQAETPFAFWGPRGISSDSNGYVYVTDTGNKRVVVFDENGESITEFGEIGFESGQFDEPVGIDVDDDGNVYVADTWNQRIQVLAPQSDGNYLPSFSWDVVAWYGQSLENKPFLTLDNDGHLFSSDPSGNRILEFTLQGEFIRYWGDLGVETDRLNIPLGIAPDQEGHLWVADSGNNRIVRYTLP